MISLDTISNEYLRALILFVAFAIFALVVRFVLFRFLTRRAEQTETDVDNTVLDITAEPIFLAIIFTGMYYALLEIPALLTSIDLINKLYFLVLVLIASFVISRLLSFGLSRWMKIHHTFKHTPKIIKIIVDTFVYLIAVAVVLSYYNVNVTPFLATLGIGGLAIGLALKDTLTNFFAGLYVVSERHMTVGDFIQIDDKNDGYIEDIGWRSTKLRTRLDTIIVVPNAVLAESKVINYSTGERGFRFKVPCTVAYNSDLERVEKVVFDVASRIQKNTEGAVKDYVPTIRFYEFKEATALFWVYLRVESYDYRRYVAHEFLKALKDRFDKEKILNR